MRAVGSVLFVLALCAAVLYGGPALAAVTPEGIRSFFDGQAIIIMFVWGLLCKYFGPLAKVPNALIPWISVAGYILTAFAVPQAHAQSGVVRAIPDAIGVLIGGAFSNAVWARQLYEGFARSFIEKLLGWKKAK